MKQTDQIISQLTELPVVELRRVQTAVEKIIKLQLGAVQDQSTAAPQGYNEELFFNQLMQAVNEKLGVGGYTNNFVVFKNHSAIYTHFHKGFDTIEQALNETFGYESKPRPRRFRTAFYRMCARLIVDSAHQHVVAPFSLNLCINTISSIFTLIENAYPGYMRTGLLQLAITKNTL